MSLYFCDNSVWGYSLDGNSLDEWVRRRVRIGIRKQWCKIKSRHDNLVKPGINNRKGWKFANTKKGYRRISNSPILSCTSTNEYLNKLGFISLIKQYPIVYSFWRTAVGQAGLYGDVGESAVFITTPYPDRLPVIDYRCCNKKTFKTLLDNYFLGSP